MKPMPEPSGVLPTLPAVLIVIGLLLLSGCSWMPTRTVTVMVSPPDALIQPRPAPVMPGKTWRDLADYALQLREWGGACELDKAALREWVGD